ncbi:hypothetical protein MHI18_10180 [Peribacillus sp. FSL H8-0477]|uniref:hypothetical protein n=1 Tax=Peribacillus sp. FSL H8-0477 TaxID=2921388 RepID=UPI0030FBCA98
MIKQTNDAFKALDTVQSSFNKGNFSKAESDAVQKLIDNLLVYVNSLPYGKDQTELLGEIATIQNALNAKVESRYIKYKIVEGESNLKQLKLTLSTGFFQANAERSKDNKIIYLNSSGEANTVYIRYLYPDTQKPAAGDTFKVNMRFNGGYKNIDVTFINQGEGKWDIESDWLVK